MIYNMRKWCNDTTESQKEKPALMVMQEKNET